MWGYNIYEPVNPTTSVDFAIKKGDKWATIQVKTTLKEDGVRLKRARNIKNNRLYPSYVEGDFDYLFGVKFPKVYVVPFVLINNKSYIGFKDYEEYAYDLNDPETYNNPPQL